MPPYVVIDACLAGAWSFPETYTAQAQKVLDAIEAQRVIAIVPDRFAEEILRVCQKKTTGGAAPMTPTDAFERFLEIMTSPLVFHPSEELHEPAWNLAVTIPGLTTHDALYLACAMLWDAELWTLDAKLASVPKTVFSKVHDLRSEIFPY
jgi:predicted nucleic acid-binding protein